MESTFWTVTVEVEVRSPDTLFEQAVSDRLQTTPDTSDLGTADNPIVEACLLQLIDPGSLDGCKVIGSSAE